MTALRAAELARIQSTNAGWLPQLATITRPSTGQTTDGFPAAPDVIATNVPCRAQPATSRGGQERMVGAGIVSGAEWVVIFDASVPVIKSQDTITVTGVGVFNVESSTSTRGVQTDTIARCSKADVA